MPTDLVFLNGDFIPLAEARISVLDRGFIFGDGVYEVVPVYDGKAFRADYHFARLARSLQAIGMDNPYSREEWQERAAHLIRDFGPGNQMVYIQVTRGVARRAHAFPKEPVTPTIFMMTNPMVLPSAEVREKGIRCVTMDDQRWLRCDIKSVSLLGNVLAAQFAAESGVPEVIQFRQDLLTEGSSSNVWVVRHGQLMAPPTDHLILKGIRYDLLRELAVLAKIPFEARPLTRQDVFEAEEVMITSATKEIVPVVEIDGKKIGNGQPGPVYAALYEGYQSAKQRD